MIVRSEGSAISFALIKLLAAETAVEQETAPTY
jgi:hypothetical protein